MMGQIGWQDVLRLRSTTLHVFVAMWMVGLPTTAEMVAEATGLCVKSVRRHLRVLLEKGLVVRAAGRGSWTLSLEALELGQRFLFLSAAYDDDDVHYRDHHHHHTYNIGEKGMGFPQEEEVSSREGKYLPVGAKGDGKFLPAAGTRYGKLVPVGQVVDGKIVPVTREVGGKFLPAGKLLPATRGSGMADSIGDSAAETGGPAATQESSSRALALRPVLEAHGIHWNWKTAQLANCSWVTTEYVKAHVKARPKNLGLAITLMLQGAAAPESDEDDDYYDIDFS
jgi:hypothetical protein